MALGGTTDGRVEAVTNRTTFGEYPLNARQGEAQIEALSNTLATFGAVVRDGVNQAADGATKRPLFADPPFQPPR